MSKKYQKQKQRKRFPWLLAVLGGLLVVIAAFLFSNRDSGTPVATVDQELIDYGEVKLDTPLTFSFVVTNTGDGVLRFKEKPYVEVREGC
ncbi:MAG TPA: hypothetical protein VHP14_05405 [Anaerolineales bacterium]|nr:hypothetical protein [Anaerolineales bacterium]